MDKPEIKFGDKIFLYGQLATDLCEYGDYEYNSVMGYMTVGGYHVNVIETDLPGASVPGYVADMGSIDSLASPTAFNQMEMVDVTEKLSLSLPLPSGTKIWMPLVPPLVDHNRS